VPEQGLFVRESVRFSNDFYVLKVSNAVFNTSVLSRLSQAVTLITPA